MRMRFEHLVLFLGGQAREQRHDLNRVGPAHVDRARAVMTPQGVLELMDVAFAGREHQNVARAAVVAGMDDQFGAGARHRGRHVDGRIMRVLGVRRGRQRRVIGVTRHRAGLEAGHGPHQRGRGAQRLVHDLHGIGASGNLDDRHLRMQRMLEMLLELHRIDRRRGDDQLQVVSLRQQRGQIPQQEIDVQTSLMRLVDHDGVVLHQLRIALDLRQQDAVRHHAQPRLRRALVGEPHLIADLVAQPYAHLRGDAFRHGAGREPARLRMHDLPAMRAAAKLQQDLRQLRGLAGTRLAGDDHHLAGAHRLGDVLAGGGNRQLGRIFEFHALTTSMTRKPFELAYLPTS